MTLRPVALVAAALLAAPPFARADEASRTAKMVELVSNVNLPYVQRMFAILMEETRRELPRKFAERMGSDGKLGAAWKPGNPHFDRVEARLEARFAESEREGRLSAPARSEIARILRTGWSEEDIEFLTRYIKTDAGRQLLEFIDTLTVPALRSALAKNAQAPANFEPRTADIALEATQRLGAIAANLGKLFDNAKEDTERAMALAKGLDAKSGELVGQLWAGKLFAEFVAIASKERFEIRVIVDEFRRAEGFPAPGSPAPSRL